MPACWGLMLVFYLHQRLHRQTGKKISWGFILGFSLLVGLLYLLMIPLGIIDTGHLYHASSNSKLLQLSQQFQQIKDKLKSGDSEQLKQIFHAPLDSQVARRN